MQVVILVAGEGIRMGELTKNCPKPMLPIKGRPKLAYTLENLPATITEVILVVGYLNEQVRNFFGNNYAGKKIRYVEQIKINGSAGAVNLTRELIQGRFMVLMGDDLYLKSDLEKLLKYPQSILVYETNRAEQFGLVTVDENNYLLEVVERPHGKQKGLVNTGAYVLSRKYFKAKPVAVSKTEYGLPQTLVTMYPKNKVKIVVADKWQPIGCPENYQRVQRIIKDFIN